VNPEAERSQPNPIAAEVRRYRAGDTGAAEVLA
jgi:hypothetical protein